MTVGEMLTRNACKFPGKTALVSESVSLGFRALNERVNRLASVVIKKGASLLDINIWTAVYMRIV